MRQKIKHELVALQKEVKGKKKRHQRIEGKLEEVHERTDTKENPARAMEIGNANSKIEFKRIRESRLHLNREIRVGLTEEMTF